MVDLRVKSEVDTSSFITGAENVNKLNDGVKDLTDSYEDLAKAQALSDNNIAAKTPNVNQNQNSNVPNPQDIEKNQLQRENTETLKAVAESNKTLAGVMKALNKTQSTFNGVTGNLQNGDAFNAAGSAGGGLGSLLSGVGLGGAGLALMIGAGAIAGVDKLAQPYKKLISTNVNLQALYGSGEGEATNNAEMRSRNNRIANAIKEDKNIFGREDYLSVMQNLAAYGLDDKNGLGSARDILNWQHNSGADRNALMSVAGLAERFGGDSESALKSAYQGLQAGGMNIGQFTEFLNGIERVMEEGVSKGFTKSAEEVSADLSVLAKLSDGDKAWQGQYGLERISKISNSLESSTALNSVTNIINYNATNALRQSMSQEELSEYLGGNVSSDSRIANMQIMEKGFSTKLLPYLFNSYGEMYGNDFERTGAFMQGLGLNATEATKFNDMYNKFKKFEGNPEEFAEKYAEELNSLKDSLDNKSTESEFLKNQNTIKDEMIKISGCTAKIEGSVLGLVNKFIGKSDAEQAQENIDENGDTSAFDEKTKEALSEDLSKSSRIEGAEEADSVIRHTSMYDEDHNKLYSAMVNANPSLLKDYDNKYQTVGGYNSVVVPLDVYEKAKGYKYEKIHESYNLALKGREDESIWGGGLINELKDKLPYIQSTEESLSVFEVMANIANLSKSLEVDNLGKYKGADKEAIFNEAQRMADEKLKKYQDGEISIEALNNFTKELNKILDKLEKGKNLDKANKASDTVNIVVQNQTNSKIYGSTSAR